MCRAAAVGVLLAGSSAMAQEPGARSFAASESPIKAAALQSMAVVLRPSHMHAGQPGGTRFGDRGPGCTPTLASRTDANFAGGSFIVEAGFAQSEIAAVSYLLPASAFPIKIDLMEVILATSNASGQTVTQWSILVWDGEPNSGTLVAEYSSDDAVLQHARVGPGTAGVNIQVSVDPSDPQQIFCTDANQSHKFSIGFRIDHHNAQTGDPCFTAPPTSSNAFPCVDTSGRSAPADNWLFGVNCGSFGCPPNGGWVRFRDMGFCTPSGDWVMRATWESVNCAPPTGACCSSTSCSLNTQSLCTGGGGVYQGDNTACTPSSPCTGACCFSGNTCQVRTASSCAGFGGTFAGNNVACTNAGTCPTGACCLANGSCVASQLASQCVAQGGTLQAVGSACSPNPCPQPTGACCFTSTGFCSVETQPNCNIPGAVWGGAGSVCSTVTCPNTGACCASNGFCSTETSANCSGVPGATFQGIGTSCSPSPCSSGTGACCCGASCTLTASASCTGSNAAFLGAGTACNASGNATAPCCKADYNHVGGISVQDIFDFLSGYFTASPCADVNGSGVSVQDIFDFLGAYFAGGC